MAIAVHVHITGVGLGPARFEAWDIVQVRPEDYGFSAVACPSAWVKAGNDIRDFPGNCGLIRVSDLSFEKFLISELGTGKTKAGKEPRSIERELQRRWRVNLSAQEQTDILVGDVVMTSTRFNQVLANKVYTEVKLSDLTAGKLVDPTETRFGWREDVFK